MSVAEGLTAAKAGVDLAKRLMDTLNRPDVDVHSVRGQLQEMLIHVVNAQVALAEAQMEISELRQKVEDRNALRSINETLEFAEDVYWRRKNDRSLDGPFCPTCWDVQNKLVRLKFYEEGEFAGIGHAKRYDCVLHKTRYFLKREILGLEDLSGRMTCRSHPPFPSSVRQQCKGWADSTISV